MTWFLLMILTGAYALVLFWLHSVKRLFTMYLFGAFGLAFLIVQLSVLQNWHISLQDIEAQHIRLIMSIFNIDVQVINGQTLIVPDSTGWSALSIGAECSSLLELAVFIGLMAFYPRLSLRRRWTSFVVGVAGIYVLNLGRILIIVMMVLLWGKTAVPFAHVIVARFFYFGGIVLIYWVFFTRPMLAIIRHTINTQERQPPQQVAYVGE